MTKENKELETNRKIETKEQIAKGSENIYLKKLIVSGSNVIHQNAIKVINIRLNFLSQKNYHSATHFLSQLELNCHENMFLLVLLMIDNVKLAKKKSIVLSYLHFLLLTQIANWVTNENKNIS